MYAFAQRSDTQVLDEPLYASYLRLTGLARPYREQVRLGRRCRRKGAGRQASCSRWACFTALCGRRCSRGNSAMRTADTASAPLAKHGQLAAEQPRWRPPRLPRRPAPERSRRPSSRLPRGAAQRACGPSGRKAIMLVRGRQLSHHRLYKWTQPRRSWPPRRLTATRWSRT